MKTYSLACEKRDMAIKAKNLRKSGFVPAVVYGRHIDSISIQIKQEVVTKLLQTHSAGSKIMLNVDGEELLAIIKEYNRNPANRSIVHMEFHALTMGEKVKVTIPVNFLNRDSVAQGSYLQEQLSEIEISTLPEYLIDRVSVDVSKYSLGDSVYVSDLDVSTDENIEVLTPQESLICAVTHAARIEEETPDEDAEAEEGEGAEAEESTEE